MKKDFEVLMGKNITVWCGIYIYHGKLVDISDHVIYLEDPAVIYETGSFEEKHWRDAQPLNVKVWSVTFQSIESYGIMNKEIDKEEEEEDE